MEIKILTIRELIEVNRILNRRLRGVDTVIDKRSDLHLVDADDKRIEAKPIYIPDLISTTRGITLLELARGDEGRREYCLNFGFYAYYLTLPELELVLGKDYPYELLTPTEINAICEASTSGPRDANAYVLGGDYRENRPVQYYIIDPKRHTKLGIESDKKRLDELVKEIEREREVRATT